MLSLGKTKQVRFRSNIMEQLTNLTLEQKFKLRMLQEQVKTLTKEQAQEFLMELFRQMMVKDNLFKQLLKNA